MAIPFKSNVTVPNNWSLKTEQDTNLLSYNGILNIGNDGATIQIKSGIAYFHTSTFSLGTTTRTILKFTNGISTELGNSNLTTNITGSSIKLTGNTTIDNKLTLKNSLEYVSQNSDNTTFSGLKIRKLYYDSDEKCSEKQVNLSISDTGYGSSLNGYQLVGILVGIRTNVSNSNLTYVDGYNIFIPLLANSYGYTMSSMGSGWYKENKYYSPPFTVENNVISPYVNINNDGSMIVYSGHNSYAAINQIVGIYSTVMFEHFYDEPN